MPTLGDRTGGAPTHRDAPMTDTLESPAIPAEAPAPAAPKRGGGPRTLTGKAQSRKNSLKHGLCSRVVLPDDLAEAVARRTAEFIAEFQPRSPYEAFLVREMALASARLDRCASMSIVGRDRGIERARLIWDHDRRIAVEEIGAKLARDPARVAPALRGRKQGADWLIERWELLGEILRNTGAWTDDQRRLALDLLGVPVALRDGGDILPPAADAEALAALVADQVAMLHEDQEAVLDALDRTERSMALAGMPAEEDAASARLRKYEASCRRALNAARAELLRLREATATAAGPAPAGPPPSHRAPLSGAAIDNLAKRSRVAMAMGAEAPSEPAPAPVVERPAAAPAPAPARSAPVPAASSMNRRERRAQAKRDRQAARSAGSAR